MPATCPACGFESTGIDCPRCGIVFSKWKPRPAAPPPRVEPVAVSPAPAGPGERPFNARWISTLSPDRQYRVYLRGSRLYLIRYAGQPVDAVVSAALFGVLGGLVLALFQGQNGGAPPHPKIAELDALDPERALSEHKHNLRIDTSEIAASRLEPPFLMYGQHGRHVGRWKLTLKNGQKLLLQLPEPADGEIAAAVLPRFLGSLLEPPARWEPARQAFVK